MSINRKEVLNHLENLLQTQRIRDYCPNGLQVAGTEHIKKVISGVTANQALIDIAIAPKPQNPVKC